MDALKWLLVGAGDIARKRVAAALAEAADSELVAVCDVNPEAARTLAEERGIPEVYGDLETALARSAAQAVYVATPVGLHVPQAVQALEAGRHVLVEKPLGLDAERCAPLLEAADQSDRKVGCSYYRRLFPAYRETRRMLEEERFGQVVLARMVYFSWFDPSPEDPKRWRVLPDRSGGGPLSDMGTHMLDVLIGLLGMPTRVYARTAHRVHAWEVEDTVSVLMEMPEGTQVTASFSWSSRTWRHEFELVGTEAKIYWHPYDSGQVVRTVGRQVEELDLSPAANVHQPLVEDFVQAVREDREPVCPPREALRTTRLVDAIYRSARTGQEVAP